MTIYIGNTTRQEMEVNCRLPGMGRVYNLRVSSGCQAEIRNLETDQESCLILHLVQFGGIERSDLHGKTKGFQGWVYSSQPMKMDEFHYGHEIVMDAAETRSVIEASKAALAADMVMRDKTGKRQSVSTEIEMQEEHPEKGKSARKMRVTIDPNVSNGDRIPLQ